jgi:hypothetical protein
MKNLGIAGLVLLTSGCAVFSGSEKSAAYTATSPAVSPAAAARRAPGAETFTAAYGVGRPVALIPCSRGAVLTDDCRAANDRHQVSGGRAVDGEETIFTEASTTIVPK